MIVKHPKRWLFASLLIFNLTIIPLPALGLVGPPPFTWFESICYTYIALKLTFFFYHLILDLVILARAYIRKKKLKKLH